MNTTLKSSILGILLASVLAGCAVGTPYQRPDVAMPAQWEGAAKPSPAVSKAITTDWWKQFGNAELNQLMDQALAANPSDHDRVRSYLEREQPHLLRAYDADFLADAVIRAMQRCLQSLTASGTRALPEVNWTEKQWEAAGF